ncbi:unnamed protein product [Rotaria sp. Silwood1]|nr:unnamed protein product [Rotaria sp. Silwood1]
MNTNFLIIGAVIATAFALGLGLIIGHFGITKKTSGTSWKYNRLTRPADPKNYRTFIDSIEAANIEANLKNLTSRSHMAGLLEDLESAQVIEEQWKLDGLQVTQPKYNVLLSYPDDSELNRYFFSIMDDTYNDPANYASFGITADQVYDQKWYMPPRGVQRGPAFTSNGDFLTHISIDRYLRDDEVDAQWHGGLRNVTYRYGGELRDASDAWNLGSVDPTSGTATMLEVTRVLGQMYKNEFRPQRSSMFCSWGAEEYELTGSVEYVEAAQDFVTRSKSMDSKNLYKIRVYNDQVLQLERAFLNPLGQGRDYTDFKHIIYALAKGNPYAATGCPAVSDVIASGNSTEITNPIAVATYFVHGVLSVLKEVHNFFSSY